ncbi:ABC transporter ATP-binding protein [Azospira restricta]|uniref:ABC transporter ATP-binding protein n=1 Tax=Azospira restricta TaxID=404405 RepID=A0A974PW64_9RHOO|nr:ABC transporter ATP-binding protein [Azospira restricta]QRJ62361.1 ABC transporter ATP-binding protein [Azospira restricta]
MRDTAPPPAIEVVDLVFRWPRQPAPCLDLPEFRVAAGERVFLHGPSGSGKSTLLGLLGGVAVPERGRVAILGEDLARLSGRRRDRLRAEHIGFIFQQFNLLPWLSALDNVLLPTTFSARRKARAGSERPPRDEAARLLAELDLDPAHWQKPAGTLSIGQQQRVAAARALIGRPEILVADEPTSALDAERQQLFVDLLLAEAAATGAALVFVSHDRRLAAHFDRSVELDAINRAARAPGAAA